VLGGATVTVFSTIAMTGMKLIASEKLNARNTTIVGLSAALGVGISTGLGYGDNARAALITRGIAEIARLGVAMGCNIHTFAGLAGIGDLIVTATSMHSRNNRAGILIGKGESPEQAVKEVGMVVEGINALPAAMELAAKYNVEMPIVQTVNAIVKEGMSASDALRNLMSRNRKNEMPQGYESV
jgi:glycerol-3-phosphate dehydrogenase (NAD(P)+)